MLYWITLFFWVIYAYQHAITKQRQLILYSLMSFALTIFLIIRTNNSWAGHHVILAFPPLIFAIAVCTQVLIKKYKLCIVVLMMLGVPTFNSLINISKLRSEDNKWSFQVIEAKLNQLTSERPTTVVTADWGYYYYYGLYRDKNQILYNGPLNDADNIQRLKGILRRTSTEAVFMLKKQSKWSNHIHANFQNLNRIDLDPIQDDFWDIWTTP